MVYCWQEVYVVVKVVEVKALPDFRLHVRFEDGIEGEVDLSSLAGRGVFRIWEDEPGFSAACVGSGGEVEWSEEVAICPDSLYLRITGKTPAQLFPNIEEISLGA
ncbi:MAG: DUF2442 domain-containing protein [Candidatus Eisenbacteria bacterium]|nr:DUF2442 domain-containing protein [Candidatus Eisenbacteria bacterium]